MYPPPHLSYALSPMYEWIHVCMKKKKGKEKCDLKVVIPVVTELSQVLLPYLNLWIIKEPIFYDLFPMYIVIIPKWIGSCKTPTLKLSQLYDQSWNTTSGSSLSTPWSNNRIWLDEVIDLGLGMIGLRTNTGLGNSNLGSRVGFGSKVASKSKNLT